MWSAKPNAEVGAAVRTEPSNRTRLASDPAGLRSLARAARTGDASAVDQAARSFEALLVGQMVKQMRSTSMSDGLFDSEQTKLYQDLYDQQVSSLVSEGQGLGLRKVLARQLAPPMALAQGQPARRPEDLKVPERNPWLRSLRPPAVAVEPMRTAGDATMPLVDGLPVQTATHQAATPVTIPEGVNWPPRSPEEFLAYLKPYAEQAAQTLGMDTRVLLAQSALETGWGRHVPRHADGRSSFNLFGIKADRSWEGDRVAVGTLEYRRGVAQRERAKFRSYASPADSFIDYVNFLRRNPRYRDALASTNSRDFVQGLQKAGYATDPRYASKILGICDRLERMAAATEVQGFGRRADTSSEA